MSSKGVNEGPNESKIFYFFTFLVNVEPNRSLFGVGWSRTGRAEVEGAKTDPGRAWGWPWRTKNGHLWQKNGQKFSQIFGHHPGDPCHSEHFFGSTSATSCVP